MKKNSHANFGFHAKQRGIAIWSFLILLIAVSVMVVLLTTQLHWISPAQGEGDGRVTAVEDHPFDLQVQRDRHLARHVCRTYGTPIQAPLYGLSPAQVASLPRDQYEACRRIMMNLSNPVHP
ncbi:MAG: hypothetical protein KC917_04375 [Candidatus Omnitrophica bacterium]|nr:hypothetical protein [Candidatus Omnitrophota bacterium]MCA9423877.1 hypothetical protein [Candidatus Omnitrophota bacterium]MCA9435631.1 hypothetical protein [Candidatus Omnitrophota bacterium]MCB9766952.1 hypothetical protein [Candidatus Omnitrophota bacterium]MCB9784212.1 hypothetical protein [Candidatus Omnitrophota bacterium]